MFKVTLDAGHGGRDPGGTSAHLVEKTPALAIALKCGAALMRHGVAVAQTRTSDRYPTLADRCKLARDSGSAAFVAFHADAGPTGAHGISVLWSEPRDLDLARAIYSRLEPLTPWADRGLHERDELAVLRGTPMASVLVEYDFLTNTDAAALIMSPAWQTVAAEATARGILEAFNYAYRPPVPARPPAPKATGYYLSAVHTSAVKRVQLEAACAEAGVKISKPIPTTRASVGRIDALAERMAER